METPLIPDPLLIPPTLWRVFSAGFLADQGLSGAGNSREYTIAPAGYERLMTRYAQNALLQATPFLEAPTPAFSAPLSSHRHWLT